MSLWFNETVMKSQTLKLRDVLRFILLVACLLGKPDTPKLSEEVIKTAYEWLIDRFKLLSLHYEDDGKYYEYRPKRKRLNSDEEPDPDIEEMRELFPDFSRGEPEIEKLSGEKQKESEVNERNLLKVMVCLAKLETEENYRLVGKFGDLENSLGLESAGLWAIQEMHKIGIPQEDTPLILAKQIQILHKLANRSKDSDRKVTKRNAYKSPLNSAELNALSEDLNGLFEAAGKLLKDWPELAPLKQIQALVLELLDLPGKSPIMKVVAGLEKLLVESAEWEKVASRAVSLQSWLLPLQKQVLHFRKLEVTSWEGLLDDVELESMHQTLLEGLPLMDLCYKAAIGQSEPRLALMAAVDWLRSSSLVSFNARLTVVQLCERMLSVMSSTAAEGNGLLPDKVGSPRNVADQLGCLKRYFGQFGVKVKEKLASVRGTIERDLKDFVKIAKFHDLNLWTIKDSTQKAHRQLFQMVKKYKEGIQEGIQDILQSLPPQLTKQSDQCPVLMDKRTTLTAAQKSSELLGRYSKLCHLSDEMADGLQNCEAVEELTEVLDLAQWTSDQLTKNVQYNGSDKDMEKQQRRTMNSRQKAVSNLMKSLREAEFSHRKGLQIDSDKLHEDLLFNMPSLDGCVVLNQRLEACVHARSVCISALAKPHAQVTPHLAGFMKGLVELIPHTLLEYSRSYQNAQEQLAQFTKLQAILGEISSEMAEIGHVLPQEKAKNTLESLQSSTQEVRQDLTGTKALWMSSPSAIEVSKWGFPELPMKQSPVCEWTAESTPMQRGLGQVESALIKLKDFATGIEEKSWKLVARKKHLSAVLSHATAISITCSDLTELMSSLHTDCRFDPFSAQLTSGLAAFENCCQLMDTLKCLNENDSHIEHSDENKEQTAEQAGRVVHNVLLMVQKLYCLMQPLEGMEASVLSGHVLKFLKQVLSAIETCGIKQTNELLHRFVADVEQGAGDLEAVRGLYLVVDAVGALLRFLMNLAASLMDKLCSLYLLLAGTFIKLCLQGFVDPIPQKETGDTGQKKPSTFEDFRQAGLGEGEGLQDVTEDIEETGQLEPTKGEEDKSEGAPPDDNIEKPIDMDEDFDAAMQDLDLDQDNEDSDDDGPNEEEPNVDWQMGETEQPDETQLDPRSWDENQEHQENETDNPDESARGADQVQDDTLVAKDRDEKSERDNTEGKDLDENKEEAETEEEPDQGENEELDGNETQEQSRTEDEHYENLDLRDSIEDDLESHTSSEASQNWDDQNLDEEQGMDVDEVLDDTETVEQGENPQDDDEMNKEVVEQQSLQPDTTLNSAAKKGQGQAEDAAANDEEKEKISEKERNLEQDEQQKQVDLPEKNAALAPTDQKDSMGEKGAEVRPTEKGNKGKAEEKRRHLRKENEERSLGDSTKEVWKDMAVHSSANSQEKGQDKEGATDSETWRHFPDLDAEKSIQVVDSATVEESQKEGATAAELKTGDEDDGEIEEVKIDEDREVDVAAGAELEKKGSGVGETLEDDEGSGKNQKRPPSSPKPQRPTDSTIHTVMDFFEHASQALSKEVDLMLNVAPSPVRESAHEMSESESRTKWMHYQSATHPLAMELTETLRVILEPTQASKLQGDYRTGKRLNVRKLIPYVASNFRKDKIWLRRGKKAKRTYQILIAMDDSSSMSDNKTKTLAFESLALLGQALRYLEVGSLGVCKFGESTELLHPLAARFADDEGATVVRRLGFHQTNTNIIRVSMVYC